jgi:hypothetical protein
MFGFTIDVTVLPLPKLIIYWSIEISLVVGNYQIDNPGFSRPTGHWFTYISF